MAIGYLTNAAISDWHVLIFEIILIFLIFLLRKSFVGCSKEATHLESDSELQIP